MEQEFKYFAFISYNSKDTKWGKRVQRKLEGYRMPATLCSEHGWERQPIKPVFFAPTDIQPGGLSAELQERLQASRHLIVICSPNSARSQWVGKEIEFFHSLGRTSQIHFFIIDGEPHSADPDKECFNPVVDRLGLPEILGANIHEKIYRWPWLNRERAYVQLITKLLGVEFDSIWQRHRRMLLRKAVIWTLGIIAVLTALAFTWRAGQPFDATIQLSEATAANDSLPPLHDAVVTLTLDNETKTDTVRSLSTPTVIRNIPHRFLGKPTRVVITCSDYMPLDTVITLGTTQQLAVSRDPSAYGIIQFSLWNPQTEQYVPNTPVTVGGFETTSDDEGRVRLNIPLPYQRCTYPVTSTIPLADHEIEAGHTEYAVISVK